MVVIIVVQKQPQSTPQVPLKLRKENSTFFHNGDTANSQCPNSTVHTYSEQGFRILCSQKV